MIKLSTSDPAFDRSFTNLVNARREADADVARDVRTIIASVRDEGDAALAAFTKKLDRHDPNETGWRIEKSEWLAAYDGLAPELRDALNLAAERSSRGEREPTPAPSRKREGGRRALTPPPPAPRRGGTPPPAARFPHAS